MFKVHKNIKKTIFNSLSDTECHICKISDDQMTMKNSCVTICGHMFHEKCMDRWISESESESDTKTCPLCKEVQPINDENEDNMNTLVINDIHEHINMAIKDNKLDILKFILDNNEDIRINARDGTPPLCLAVRHNHHEMVEFILSLTDLYIEEALSEAIGNNINKKIVKLLLDDMEYIDDLNDNVDDSEHEIHTLFRLGQTGDYDLIKLALDKNRGKNIHNSCVDNLQWKNRNRIIHGCIENRHNEIAKKILDNY